MIRRSLVPRPSIAVVVPFRGTEAEATRLLAALGRLEPEAGDEVVVVDNEGAGAFDGLDHGGFAVSVATAERSSYYARNAGAELTDAPWILFMDADCVPSASLLDAYFDPEPGPRCAVVAGSVRAARGASLAARYAASRHHLDETFHLEAKPYPAGITANLLVRRQAWESLGGFHEGVRSGADVELCWRIQEAGWGLEHRPSAVVDHRHPESLGELVRKAVRYGAGRRWVNRRYPGSMPRPRLARELTRAIAGGFAWPLAGKPERGAFKLIDGAYVAAGAWGYVAGDSRAELPRRERTADDGNAMVLSTDAFPARSETFVYNEALALRDLGSAVRVEAAARPARVERAVARALRVDYVEDYFPPGALKDLAWLAARHPLRCARDLAARRRWSAEEPVLPLRAIASPAHRLARSQSRHVHVNFAAGAALTAMRLHMLVGSSYSVTAHGYDVFQEPRNLAEKLMRAAFVVAPCEYTADHLRARAPGLPGPVHVIVMGVDGERFRRRRPYPGDATVVGIGRLVEKKGFEYLIAAAAELRERGVLERLVIAGDGPLRDALSGRLAREGLGEAAELVEAWGAEPVRELLERADVLACPSVIAADGDREAMPMVVKEALAMGVPVVTSDAAGLPELVRREWGRMVPQRDPTALADAIEEVLGLSPTERERMGEAGRAHVLTSCSLRGQAERLAALSQAVRQ